jgi:hypothetical protein
MTASRLDFPNWSKVAQASYSIFDAVGDPESALTGRETGDFTDAQASRFLGLLSDPLVPQPQGLELRHHQPNDLSGFSATVFFDRSAGRYVLAIRGTEGLIDALEDVNRIGLQGYAGDQAVSLYRYYKKLITPAGQPVQYSNDEVGLLASMRLKLPVRLSLFTAAFPLLRAELSRDQGLAPLGAITESCVRL